MSRAALSVCLLFASTAVARAASPGYASVSRGTRSFYGTNFGNRYQYMGLGYGYARGTPGVGFGMGAGRGGYGGYGGGGYGGGGYGGYGRSGGYGGYGGSGRNGGILTDLQLEQLHQQRMMWSMQFAPMPETAPGVTYNRDWNPYQSRLADDIYHREYPAPLPQAYENPFIDHHATREAK
ncbi:MAG: hypothetical protein ACREHD_03320 [Pirellulales bacterium]